MSSTSILYKTRRLLQDFGEFFTAQIAGDGITTVFELPENMVDASSLSVTVIPSVGGATISTLLLGTDYSVDTFNGILQTEVPPVLGDVLNVAGKHFSTWDDNDLGDYVITAFGLHTAGRNPAVYLDPVPNAVPPTKVLPYVEERCVAILAAKLVLEDEATAAAEDITIDTGDGTVIPRSQRYQQLINEVARLEQQYQNLVSRLGLQGGIDAISVTNLRRTSYTTNRLIPDYVPREWDNPTYVQRILPPIDTGIPNADEGAVVSYRGEYNPQRQYRFNDEVAEGSYYYLCIDPNGALGIDPTQDVAAGDSIHGRHWQKTTINSGMAGYYGGW